MDILVIGSSGQVAQALAERAGQNRLIASIGRPELDVRNPSSVSRAIDRIKPRLVINASAYTAVDKAESEENEAFAVNAEGAGHVASVCANRGLPLIHYSTDYVFDGEKATPYLESDEVNPLGVYGRSKLEGERAIARSGARAVILRTAWVYSPFGQNFVKTMIRLAKSHSSVRIVADQFGCPTSALDLADATLTIAPKLLSGEGPEGIFHTCGQGEASWHEFAAKIFEVLSEDGQPQVDAVAIKGSEFPTAARRPANSRLDGTKLAEAYGIRLPDWRESLPRCVARILKESS